VNPEDNNQNANQQEVNPTAHHYKQQLTPKGRSKKFLYVAVLICVGIILIAVLAVIAYNASGDRTQEKFDRLENNFISDPSSGSVDVPESGD
jgi:hypothetical protein